MQYILNENIQIQEVLSLLVTNTKFVLNLLENPESFTKKYGLKGRVKSQLLEFVEKSGVNFLNSSLLLNKKRFDSIVDALLIVSQYFDKSRLFRYFNSYMACYDLGDEVSKNPIIESVLFCKYILNFEILNPYEHALLNYELLRNQVIVDHGLDINSYIDNKMDVVVTEKNHEKYKVFFHPSSLIHKFDSNVSFYIKNKIDSPLDMFKQNEEWLLFYKDWQKGGIVTLKISKKTAQFCDVLMNAKNLKEAYMEINELENKVSFDDFISGVGEVVSNNIAFISLSK